MRPTGACQLGKGAAPPYNPLLLACGQLLWSFGSSPQGLFVRLFHLHVLIWKGFAPSIVIGCQQCDCDQVIAGHNWSHLVTAGLTWTSHVTWSHVFLPGHSWSQLGTPGHKWSHMFTTGHFWSHLGIPCNLVTYPHLVTAGHNLTSHVAWSHVLTWSLLVTNSQVYRHQYWSDLQPCQS